MPRPRRQPDATIGIDAQSVRAYEGETILSAARRAGVHIPTLCYVDGLSVYGGCRICVVEVGGEQPLRLACATPVVDEMEITTASDRLVEHRRQLVELLFAEGNHICSVCVSNGACELQDSAVDLGIDHIRFDYQFPDRGVDHSHPQYGLDHNRCILCTRCVRVCDEIEGARVWDVASRGSGSYIVAELGQPWGESVSCTSCGKCVAVCPTGALFTKGVSVGEMRHDVDVVGFLDAQRSAGEWTDRGEPA
jgi:bidirectional [NiFe] hydrogenase diaphorase subunit